MSHPVYQTSDPQVALAALIPAYMRMPSSWPASGPVWDPPLTADEQGTYDDLQRMAHFGLTSSLTLDEFRAIKADLATGRAFLGIASPTQAQAIAAEKAIIRVLGALLRDS